MSVNIQCLTLLMTEDLITGDLRSSFTWCKHSVLMLEVEGLIPRKFTV